MARKIQTTFEAHREIVLFLSVITIFRLFYIYFIPILPQEAYYWYYSLKPDFSYYDHPPMAAYTIWLGTTIFGDTVFGVKFIGVIWSALTNLTLYITARIVFEDLAPEQRRSWSFRTVLLYNMTLFAHIYAVIIVPDTPLLFFWSIIILMTVRFQRSEQVKFLYFAGMALGFGMLSKYTAVAILPAILIILIIDRRSRRIFSRPHPYLALLLACLIFMPVVCWNIRNDWASFGFQFSERAGALRTIQSKYILQLIASQFFILTPLPMILLFSALWVGLKRWWKNADARNLVLTGVFIIGGFIMISLRSLVKMNWLMPGYLGLVIAAAALFRDKGWERTFWVKAGSALSLVLVLAAHIILLVPNIPLGEGNTWSGWRDAAQQISEIQAQKGGESGVFIFTNSYKAASLIKFYLGGDQDVYAQNIYGQPALQFDIWGVPDSLRGKDALYVFSDRYEYKSDLPLVRNYFESVQPLKEFRYSFGGSGTTRVISCYYARGYKPGSKPAGENGRGR